MNLNGKSLAELNEVLEEVKVAIAKAKVSEQVGADQLVRSDLENVAKGTLVNIVFKGEKIEAVFEKLTEKRFTVKVEGVAKSIMFDKFVGLV